MKTSRILVITALPLVLALGAQAQSADTQYCQALGSKYDRYVNNPSMGRGSQPPNGRIDEAKSQCGGNPSYAIPILEQALKDARVDLPPRG
jgi:hypothetical protein